MGEIVKMAVNIATATGCIAWGDALTIALVLVGARLCGKRLSLSVTDREKWHIVQQRADKPVLYDPEKEGSGNA